MDRTDEVWAQLVKEKISDIKASLNPTLSQSTFSSAHLAQTIDHTLLKPDATPTQIDELCDQAIQYGFKSCCVNGVNIPQVAKRLAGTSTMPCSVIGFPLGAGTTRSKAFEAQQAILDGAKEIDMVINIGALKSGHYVQVYEDIRSVVEASGRNCVKVILETVFLSDEEKIAASFISAEAGAAFVKTCTGFSGGGASVADVALMKKAVTYKGGTVKVKASAGVRSHEKCLEMLRAGADRIGTSSGVVIMQKAGTNDADTY